MADHEDRHTCGRCGTMYYKMLPNGERMPVPKIKKPQAVVAAPKAAAAKGKKKK